MNPRRVLAITRRIVEVEVVSYASRYVTVLGAVGSPGLIPMDRPYRLSEILARVGGARQDGADHVDAHRSTSLVISKYSPGSAAHPWVDHNFYTTVNMIHTMEELLGLPPMNNNDAFAPMIAPQFAGPGDQAPYVADTSNRENGLIYTANTRKSPGAAASLKMDFRHADRAPAQQLNVILWKAAKGDAPVPVMITAKKKAAHKDDDDD